MRHRPITLTCASVAALTAITAPLPPGAAQAAAPAATAGGTGRPAVADLRVDADRDGRIGPGDRAQEDRADNAAGALFLANIDDDSGRCPAQTKGGNPLSVVVMARCHDAADRIVNGPADARDLARVEAAPMQGLSSGAVGHLRVDPAGREHVTVFVLRSGHWQLLRPGTALDATDLRGGLTFGVEGRDATRRPSGWNGTAEVTLVVSDHGHSSRDSVRLHQAPILTASHLAPARRLLVTTFDREQAEELGDADLAPVSRRLAHDLDSATEPLGMDPAIRLRGAEMFPQDFFESMSASIPGPGGRPQTMRVLLQSPQHWRDGARELYTRLRGRDVAMVLLPEDAAGKDGIGQTLSSTGNLETIPPYSYRGHDYPQGRVILGADPRTGDRPAPSLTDFVEAQGMQDPLLVDSAWTFVSHVDEFLQFLPADTPLGWRVAVADPRAGLEVLKKASREGHGDAPLFSKNAPYQRLTTIDEYLDDPDRVLLDETEIASSRVEAAIALLESETGITEADIVRVPALFGSIELEWGHEAGSSYRPPLTAFMPDAVNGILLDRTHVLVPQQGGPRLGGRDIFEDAVRDAYAAAGITTTFVDAHTYDVNGGSLHCATNVLRKLPARWWLTAS